MKNLSWILMILVLPVLAGADDAKPTGPKSPAAVAAIQKYEFAAKKAKADYDTTLRAATVVELQELDSAKVAATKAGNLDEANAIVGAIRKASAATGAPTAAAGGEIRKQILASSGATYVRYGRSSSVTLKPDGSVWEGTKKWDGVHWDTKEGSNGEEALLYSDGSGQVSLVRQNPTTFVGLRSDNVPVAVVVK